MKVRPRIALLKNLQLTVTPQMRLIIGGAIAVIIVIIVVSIVKATGK